MHQNERWLENKLTSSENQFQSEQQLINQLFPKVRAHRHLISKGRKVDYLGAFIEILTQIG